MLNSPKFVSDINTDNKTVTLKGESFSHSLSKGDDYRVLVDFVKADLLNPEGL